MFFSTSDSTGAEPPATSDSSTPHSSQELGGVGAHGKKEEVEEVSRAEEPKPEHETEEEEEFDKEIPGVRK